MDNFDLKKYLAEGRLFKEQFDGEMTDNERDQLLSNEKKGINNDEFFNQEIPSVDKTELISLIKALGMSEKGFESMDYDDVVFAGNPKSFKPGTFITFKPESKELATSFLSSNNIPFVEDKYEIHFAPFAPLIGMYF